MNIKKDDIQEISNLEMTIDQRGDEHFSSSTETPMRADAFFRTDDEKLKSLQIILER